MRARLFMSRNAALVRAWKPSRERREEVWRQGVPQEARRKGVPGYAKSIKNANKRHFSGEYEAVDLTQSDRATAEQLAQRRRFEQHQRFPGPSPSWTPCADVSRWDNATR